MSTPTPAGLKYLVLGGGAVVAEFYLPALSGLGWLNDVWVADPSKDALDRLTMTCSDVKVLQMDFGSALHHARELGVQAVIVALPNALHDEAVTLALDCGLDVLCEKPLAMSQVACRRLADQAARLNRVLAVGMTRRFLPSTKAFRGVIDAGWLGEITSVEVEDGHNFAWSSESGAYGRPDNAGVLANIGVHALDLVEYLCGPLTPVSYADDWHGGVEANATFELATALGARVHLKFSYTHSLRNNFTVRGTRGEAWQDSRTSVLHYRRTDERLYADVSATPLFKNGDQSDATASAIRAEFLDFRESALDRRPPCAAAEDAVRAAGLIDWAYSHHAAERLTSLASVDSIRPSLAAGRMIVTGGTGFVGGHLIEALSDQGHRDIVVPVRSYQRSANCWRFPVQLQRTDLLDPASVRRAMAGCRYVFHLAYGRDGANVARITIEGTRNIIEAAIDAGAECVVVLSTTALFGDPGGSRPVDESFPYGHPNREYENTKAEAERIALALARQQTRTRIVVISPSCIYGPGGKTFVELPARLLHEGAFCWIEGGHGIVNYVHVANLVDAILLAASSQTAHGERFIVSDGFVTWREFFFELFGQRANSLPSCTREELLSLERRNRRSLRDVARTVARSDELWRMVRENPWLASTKAILETATPGLYRRVKNARNKSPRVTAVPSEGPRPPVYLDDLFGLASTRLTAAKAERVLGWHPRIDFRTGMETCRAWLRELGLDPHDEGLPIEVGSSGMVQ